MPTPRTTRARAWRGLTLAGFAVAGGLFVTSGLTADGLDLRVSSVSDLDTVVHRERSRTDGLQKQVADLNREVSSLSRNVDDTSVAKLQARVDRLRDPAGLAAVAGPGVTVTLNDAPEEEINRVIESGEVTAEDLVVHQQDIQAVVNALWAGGAEAITVQDQRVISTTGIKCVGNTVILHGVPYSPPYVIKAIGPQSEMLDSLELNDYIAAYRVIADEYQLGFDIETVTSHKLPAFAALLELKYAKAAGSPAGSPAGNPAAR